MSHLEDKINSTDWYCFEGPVLYEPTAVPSALCALLNLRKGSDAEKVGNNLINSIGSNHAGIYYPVVLKALDFVIQIAQETDNRSCWVCSLAVLNDIYYFSPELGSFDKYSSIELEQLVKQKLKPYNDENINFNQ